MMRKAWSSIEEVPYCFSRSSVKFQGHIALKIIEFDPNWAFPDCNSSLNSPMTMKCCTKLETAKKRCPIVFQGHPSNFKVTRDKTSPILTQIGRFRTIGRSQLSNPSDLPCLSMVTQMHQYWSYHSPVLSLLDNIWAIVIVIILCIDGVWDFVMCMVHIFNVLAMYMTLQYCFVALCIDDLWDIAMDMVCAVTCCCNDIYCADLEKHFCTAFSLD